MGTYKYQAEIDALIQQGVKMPEVVKPNDLKGFRFVFSSDMSKSYLPNYIMKPQRAIMNGQRKVDVGGYALSCFIEKDKAIKFYHLLAKNMRNIYKVIGDRISSAAQELVGVTDGLWCTQVVQQALANAGVSDAYQLWPDQYAGQYGYYTNDPQEGDLLYYNNGGRGVDHIAIYIGNGQAVHGNYEGKTVIASAYLSTAASPQFIRVVR